MSELLGVLVALGAVVVALVLLGVGFYHGYLAGYRDGAGAVGKRIREIIKKREVR